MAVPVTSSATPLLRKFREPPTPYHLSPPRRESNVEHLGGAESEWFFWALLKWLSGSLSMVTQPTSAYPDTLFSGQVCSGKL
ncbi:hypothetical protein FJTKL_14022 [Diaporthe vaccinii]|uniref:Uncharacterized protein n=1 Tax=Diaporthe vaccinii TaxID=105482 RepID=A0ABR4E9C0_9PEZI